MNIGPPGGAKTVVTSKLDKSRNVKQACHVKYALHKEDGRAVVSRS